MTGLLRGELKKTSQIIYSSNELWSLSIEDRAEGNGNGLVEETRIPAAAIWSMCAVKGKWGVRLRGWLERVERSCLAAASGCQLGYVAMKLTSDFSNLPCLLLCPCRKIHSLSSRCSAFERMFGRDRKTSFSQWDMRILNYNWSWI